MKISAAVYDPAVHLVGNWSRVSDADPMAAGMDPSLLENAQRGFRAGIYTDGDGDGDGHHVLVFSGFNELKDWTGANFRQGLGSAHSRVSAPPDGVGGLGAALDGSPGASR